MDESPTTVELIERLYFLCASSVRTEEVCVVMGQAADRLVTLHVALEAIQAAVGRASK